MTPSELADEIERLIISATDKFAEKIRLFQNYVYNQVLKVVKDLELDSDGYIKQSANNRKILTEAESTLDDILFGETLASTVSGAINVIPKLDKLNNAYFNTIDENFTGNRNFIKSLQQRVIESIESNLLSDGLKAQVRNPIAVASFLVS
jgi:SPX domain protein involved in polyphosphate accumulation